MIRVGLLSPTLAVRVGLRALLEAESQIDVVFEGASVDDLSGDSLALDVLILTSDILLTLDPESLFIDTQPDTAVLLLGDDTETMRVLPEFGLRAWGVLLPEFSQEELLAAVQALFEGLIVGEPSVMVSLFEAPIVVGERTLDELVEVLTEREQEVLQLLAQGLANKQIAAQLGISAHTVKFHISSIYGKLGATNRTDAVRIGLQVGLILL